MKNRFNSSKLSSGNIPKKKVSFSLTLEKEQYLKVFGNLGKRKDLSHLSIPIDDGGG